MTPNHPTHRPRVTGPLAALVAAMLVATQPALAQQADALLPDSVAGGWKVFAKKECIQCHTVWGLGGQVGPELGRTEQHLTAGQLAGAMWNHIPKMYSHMTRNHLEYPKLTQKQMTDLFSFLYFVRYLDEPGDSTAGKRILQEKGCADCHETTAEGRRPGPDLKRWAVYANPVVWAQTMWEHAPAMEQAMKDRGMTWPKLNDTDLVNIMAYIRSVGARGPKTYLQPGSPKTGAKLFAEHQCRACHTPDGAGHDLATSALPRGLAALASRMWNHSPQMTRLMQEKGLPRTPLTAQEMADVIAYIISLRYADRPGNAQRGRQVFQTKRCTECHDPGQTAAPDLKTLANATSAVKLSQAMWNHGVAMMDHMSQAGIAWPLFQFDDMADLVAYLKSLAPGQPPTSAPQEKKTKPPEPPTPETKPALSLAPPTTPQGRPKPKPTPTPETPALPARRSVDVKPVAVVITVAVSRPTQIEAGCVTAECHGRIVANQFVHGPAAQHQCDVCHELVDEKKHQFQTVEKQPDLCYQCHDRPEDDAKFIHGPVGVGMCTACHNPHSAPNQFMLPQAKNDLCFMCHSEMGAHVNTARAKHAVIQKQGCTACHDPHRAKNKFQLKQSVPEMCFACHKDIKNTIDAATTGHEPVAAGKRCINCHNPHGSDVDKILLNVEMDLCLSCHDKPLDTPNGPIVNMKAWIQANPEHHGPIRDKNCTGCHEPHGSKNFRILQHAFPKQFYRPFALETYALCFECHEETLVLDLTTTTLTGFRNGDKNLHYIHVNQKKGRTCRACHEIHAGTKPKRIKDYVPFGSWKYPVNFEKLKNGGRCAPGCHVPRAYDRTKEIIQK